VPESSVHFAVLLEIGRSVRGRQEARPCWRRFACRASVARPPARYHVAVTASGPADRGRSL